MAAQPTICISVFDTEARRQYFTHPGTLGHKKPTTKKPGSIVLLYDKIVKEVFGIGILREITKGKVCIERSFIDQDLYTKEYKKYNKYEIGATLSLIIPTSIRQINEECNLDPNTRISNGHFNSYDIANQNIRPWVNRILNLVQNAEEVN